MNEIKQLIDLLNQLNGAIALIFGFGLSQGLRKFNKWRKKDVTTVEKKVNNIESIVDGLVKSSLALSHDKLYTYCTNYINRGYITVGELDNLEYLFTSYKSLGGNGTGEHLYNEVKKLKIKGGE